MAASDINMQFLIASVNVFIVLILMKHCRIEELAVTTVILVTFGFGKIIGADKKSE